MTKRDERLSEKEMGYVLFTLADERSNDFLLRNPFEIKKFNNIENYQKLMTINLFLIQTFTHLKKTNPTVRDFMDLAFSTHLVIEKKVPNVQVMTLLIEQYKMYQSFHEILEQYQECENALTHLAAHFVEFLTNRSCPIDSKKTLLMEGMMLQSMEETFEMTEGVELYED